MKRHGWFSPLIIVGSVMVFVACVVWIYYTVPEAQAPANGAPEQETAPASFPPPSLPNTTPVGSRPPESSAVAEEANDIDRLMRREIEKQELDRIAKNTDLNPEEAKHAVDLLAEERKMWCTFKGLQAELELVITDAAEAGAPPQKLRARLSISSDPVPVASAARKPWQDRFELRDPEGQWSVFTDGTRDGTRLEGRDMEGAKQAAALFVGQGATELFLLPRQLLGSLYKDDLNPTGSHSKEEVLATVTPWKNAQAGEAENSYVYKIPQAQKNSFAFENGHFSSWMRLGADEAQKLVVAFGDYVQSGNRAFPATIVMQTAENKPSLYVRLSKVVLAE